MAKKESKVAINTVDKYLKACSAEPATVTMVYANGEAMEVKVKKALSWDEMTQMVYDAVNAVFFDVEYTEEYHPEFEEVAKANAILTYVANFKSEMSMSRVHELMYAPGFMAAILEQWSDMQYSDFLVQFRRCVDMRKNMLLSTERATLLKATAEIEKSTQALKSMTDAFANVSPEQIQAVFTNLAGMSELDLANAVVDARDDDFVEMRRKRLEVVK